MRIVKPIEFIIGRCHSAPTIQRPRKKWDGRRAPSGRGRNLGWGLPSFQLWESELPRNICENIGANLCKYAIESAYATSYWSSVATLVLPILPRFRDIVGFLRRATPPLFHPNFRGVPLGLDCRCCGSEER